MVKVTKSNRRKWDVHLRAQEMSQRYCCFNLIYHEITKTLAAYYSSGSQEHPQKSKSSCCPFSTGWHAVLIKGGIGGGGSREYIQGKSGPVPRADFLATQKLLSLASKYFGVSGLGQRYFFAVWMHSPETKSNCTAKNIIIVALTVHALQVLPEGRVDRELWPPEPPHETLSSSMLGKIELKLGSGLQLRVALSTSFFLYW